MIFRVLSSRIFWIIFSANSWAFTWLSTAIIFHFGDFLCCSVFAALNDHLICNLKLRCGFSWNGANATIDTKTILRGSMVHDALYDLMRKGLLDSSQWRETADIELARICREDGMRKSRIVILNFLVRKFGERMTKVNPKLDSVSKVDHREIN